VYLGTDFELTAGANPGAEIRQGMQVLRPRSTVSLGILGVAGLWVPVLGRLRLRAEVALGGRFVSMGYESTVGACVTSTSVGAHQLVVEPRGGVEFFLTPWTSVGVTGGTNVLEPGQVSAGLTLRFHAQAWDGVRD
jgi:hypothetical protein